MPNSVLKVIFGALIPGLVTLVFNLLNFFFDNFQTLTTAMLSLPASTFDISVGNATAILGSCIVAKDGNVLRSVAAAFALTVIAILFCEMLVPALFHWQKIYCVVSMDLLSICVLVWVIIQV